MSDRVITPEEIEAAQATLDARRERIGHDQARLNEVRARHTPTPQPPSAAEQLRRLWGRACEREA